MSEIRVYRATSFPGTPKVNAIYIIEDDTNLEVHYVDASGNHTYMKPAANVAALTGTLTGTANGALVDVAASAGACAGGSTPTATQVDTAIATAVATIVSGVNEQNKEFLTKINEIVAGQKTAKLMKTS